MTISMDFSKLVYNAKEAPRAESVTCLFYGGAGTGKTDFCGSIGNRGLFINTGAGTETIKQRYDCDIIDISEEVDPKTGIFKEAKAFDMVTEVIDWAFTQEKYKVIALDDATYFNRFARNRALEITKQHKGSQSLDISRKEGVITMAIGDFGVEMSAVEWFLSTYIPQFKSRGIHFILTAHERLFYNKASKPGEVATVRKTCPAFTGQSFPDTIPGFFDIVWRFEAAGGGDRIKYRALTAGDEDTTAKTRYRDIFAEKEELTDSKLDFWKMIERIKVGPLPKTKK